MGLNRSVAEALVEQLAMLAESMQGIAAQIEQVEDDAKRQALRAGIANLMCALNTDLLAPVICEYPDLDPESVAVQETAPQG